MQLGSALNEGIMRLGNPPIIQAWIEFRFEAAPDGPEWGPTTVDRFLEPFRGEYPESEFLRKHTFRFQTPYTPEHRLLESRDEMDGIRAFRKDRTRYFQIAQDGFACNSIPTGPEGYEGFESLKKESLAKLRSYVEFFRPAKLLQVSIQYMDLIRIPFVGDSIELNDYFRIGYKQPGEANFGSTLDFLVRYKALPPASTDILEVQFWNDQPDPDGPMGQFRIDWNLTAHEGIGFEETALSARLDRAHDYLLDCFRKSFTEKGWSLFEPMDDPKS